MPNTDFSGLLKILDIKFNNPGILEQAFIHRSYLNEVKIDSPSNERMEFLGDSVLSLVVSSGLFMKNPKDNEGDLTNLRAYIVNTKSLAKAGKKLNLGSFLKLSKGEELSGGRENTQLLANTYEALLGAIFLDQGLEVVKKVIEETLLSLFEKELEMGPPKDAKSRLQEVVQERLKESPFYKILKTHGPDHAKQFTVAVYVKGKEMGQGTGSSKQVAGIAGRDGDRGLVLPLQERVAPRPFGAGDHVDVVTRRLGPGQASRDQQRHGHPGGQTSTRHESLQHANQAFLAAISEHPMDSTKGCASGGSANHIRNPSLRT